MGRPHDYSPYADEIEAYASEIDARTEEFWETLLFQLRYEIRKIRDRKRSEDIQGGRDDGFFQKNKE